MIPARNTVTVGLVLLLGLAALSVGRRRSTARPVDAAAAQRIEDSSPARPAVSLRGSEGAGPATEDRAVVGTQPAGIHGCVRGRDGRLVAAGSVTVRGTGRSPQVVALAADGTFSVEGLEPGTWQVLVRGPDFETVSLFAEDLVAGEDREQPVLVALGPRLRGEVLDPEGRPLAGVRVTPWRRGPDGDELDPSTAVETGRGGLFEIGTGDARWCQVHFEVDGYESRSIRLSVGRFAQVCLDPSGG